MKPLKDLLFLTNYYEHPKTPFPDDLSESSPKYNPIIDTYFGHWWFGEKYKDLSSTSKKKIGKVLIDHHEIQHASHSGTTLRYIIQTHAVVIYEFLAKISSKSGDREPLEVPSLDNWPALKVQAEILKFLYQKSALAEESFSLAWEIYTLSYIKENYPSSYPFPEHSPEKLEDAWVQDATDKLGPNFVDRYEQYKSIWEHFTAEQAHTIHLYSMNVGWWEKTLELLIDGSDDTLVDITVPSKEELSGYFNFLKGQDITSLSLDNPSEDSVIFAGNNPKKRLNTVISKINIKLELNANTEKSMFDKVLSQIKSLLTKGPAQNNSNTESHPLEELFENLNKENKSQDKEFINSQHLQDLRGNYALLTNLYSLIRSKFYNSRNRYSDSQRAKSVIDSDLFLARGAPLMTIEPSGSIGYYGTISFGETRMGFLTLVFFESMRQQMFRGKGLSCPIKYLYQPASQKNSECNIANCPYEIFLKYFWDNTKPGPDAIEWTKPTCF